MKWSPLVKRFVTLMGIGVVLSYLAFYSVAALLDIQKNEQRQDLFISELTDKLTLAQGKYTSFKAGESVDAETGIIAPINAVKSALQNVYYEDDRAAVYEISTSEETKGLLKLTIVELEKITETVMTKTSDFQNAQSAFRNFENHISSQQQAHRSFVTTLAWTMVLLVFIATLAFSVLYFMQAKKSKTSFVSLETRLDQEVDHVQKLTRFIEAISSGNYSIDLNTGDQDELNGTLVAMRDRLQKNAEEDQQRNWTSAGLAQATEILRINNAQELYDSVIKFVVKYTGSNQGGLFVLTDEEQDKQLELVSCYAYERKKFISRRVGIGQGIIGQCFLEKERIHLVEIPADYVNITSGLGAANPNSLLLMPLKTNDVVYGVLELASFKAYKDHEIDWVERLAESIASTVAAVRANDNMRQLLEQTQQQAEEMKSQEEEMRQNMEELSATQEEMSRKEREYIRRISELEDQQEVPTR